MKKQHKLSLLAVLVISNTTYAEEQLEAINVTAEQQVKQSLGVSVISQKDLERDPIENDASEIIAKQPGVTLSTNAPGGARGNKRQVDIRAMGPENTLILVDGKPVKSRNSERYGRNGTRIILEAIPTGYQQMQSNLLKYYVAQQLHVMALVQWAVSSISKRNHQPVNITAV